MAKILCLARMMAALRLDAYEGAAVAKILWRSRLKEGEAQGVHYFRRGESFLQVDCAGAEDAGAIQVRLVLGKGYRAPAEASVRDRAERSRCRKKTGVMPSHGETWRAFSRDEILAFVEAVGDENSLHRQAVPIVPGLLLLSAILDRFPEIRSLEMRFFHPLYAGEAVTLFPVEKGMLGMADGEEKFLCRAAQGDDAAAIAGRQKKRDEK